MSIRNLFSLLSQSRESPGVGVEAVVPSDTNTLQNVSRQIRIGGAGDLTVLTADMATPVTIPGCVAGERFNLAVTQVMATGTTATGITSLY